MYYSSVACNGTLCASERILIRIPDLTPHQYQFRGGDVNLQIFDLEGVHLGIKTSDNSKHISKICSVSIFKKCPPLGQITFLYLMSLGYVR